MKKLSAVAVLFFLLVPILSEALILNNKRGEYTIKGKSIFLKKSPKVLPRRSTNCQLVERSCTYAELDTYNWSDLTPNSPIQIAPPSISGAVDRINDCIENVESSCQGICEAGNEPPKVYLEFDPDVFEGKYFYKSSCIRNGIKLECEENSTTSAWMKLSNGSNEIPLCHEGVFYSFPLNATMGSNGCTLPDVYGGMMLVNSSIELSYDGVEVDGDTIDLTLKVEAYDGCRASLEID